MREMNHISQVVISDTMLHCIFSQVKAKLNRQKANNTRSSQAVSHPSTILAQCCLTSVIGRELVYSTWYGRWREKQEKLQLINGPKSHACKLTTTPAVLAIENNKVGRINALIELKYLAMVFRY